MAIASTHVSLVEDPIGSIELPAIQLPPPVATVTRTNERKEFETLPQVPSEPVQRKSIFRTLESPKGPTSVKQDVTAGLLKRLTVNF